MQNLEEIIHLQENPPNNDSSNNAVQFLPDTQKEKKGKKQLRNYSIYQNL